MKDSGEGWLILILIGLFLSCCQVDSLDTKVDELTREVRQLKGEAK